MSAGLAFLLRGRKMREPTKRKPVLCYECSCPPVKCEYIKDIEVGDYKNTKKWFNNGCKDTFIVRIYKCPKCKREYWGGRKKK